MTNSETLEVIEKKLQEILKESFNWCEDDNMKIAIMAASINKNSHEALVLLERVRKGQLRD